MTDDLPQLVKPRRRGRRRWIIAGVVLAVIVLAAAVPWWLVRAEPAYWEPVDASDPAIVAAAEQVESAVTSQTTSVRPADEVWTMELSEEQANAWLAARLPMWLANQGVDQQVLDAVQHVMADVTDGRVELAAELRVNGTTQIVRLAYRPRPGVIEGEPVRLDLDGIYAGRLPVPMDALVAQLRQHIGEQDADQIAKAIQSIELDIPVDDGRRMTVVDVELSDGRAVLTCRTDRDRR